MNPMVPMILTMMAEKTPEYRDLLNPRRRTFDYQGDHQSAELKAKLMARAEAKRQRRIERNKRVKGE
ncbi:MAG: hypothetical protein WC322_05125 [Candidatus Paceibacterota bacterium]|jgi:hypothetical protein